MASRSLPGSDREALTIDREAMQIRDSLIPKYALLVYNGFWFTPERDARQALGTETRPTASGQGPLKASARQQKG